VRGASVAHAGPKYLTSAPAARSGVGQTLHCDIVNLEVSPQEVTIEVLDYNGNPATPPYTTMLAPNTGDYSWDSAGFGAFCRFAVNTSTKKFRAFAIHDDALTYTVTLPAY
jgi:hypothetical protein